ncbi:MAG: family 1 glycosylhydrolase [Janthinobacterium lividum]
MNGLPMEERLLPPSLWGGVECTVNRVGDRYFDQTERSGHGQRIEDLDLFADLGLSALRYPVLWERTAPNGLDSADWSWSDARLSRTRALGMEPVVGLVHHGSGPAHTSLLDPAFPEKLAEYAHAVAERYPWVTRYTPVNEPLTTARFSGLYGHWYPHDRDSLLFARMLLIQCRAVLLSMRAIRKINPSAQLVQTEDIGKTYSTPALMYQAEFDNERRWLSFDLLCGRVDDRHPMYHYLRWLGIEEGELAPFLENPCPPDVLGVNYYVTSERFLDERVERYPRHFAGGNSQHAYADVEAVRVRAEGIGGPEPLLREVWQRYGLPIVVTEAHLGSTPDERMRWFHEIWSAGVHLRREGIDIQAITAWSLLGTYDWNSLVTRTEGHYEAGVFEMCGSEPRPTAMAEMLRDLAATGRHQHPGLDLPGWWRRPERLLYPEVSTRPKRASRPLVRQG